MLPEAWGFVCPVHTPDGAPCGLLNHISLGCIPLPWDPLAFKIEEFITVLEQLGMIGIDIRTEEELLPILLDGRHVGNLALSNADHFVS